jgi:hypothetical protein
VPAVIILSFSDIKKCLESYGTPKPERRMGRSLGLHVKNAKARGSRDPFVPFSTELHFNLRSAFARNGYLLVYGVPFVD